MSALLFGPALLSPPLFFFIFLISFITTTYTIHSSTMPQDNHGSSYSYKGSGTNSQVSATRLPYYEENLSPSARATTTALGTTVPVRRIRTRTTTPTRSFL